MLAFHSSPICFILLFIHKHTLKHYFLIPYFLNLSCIVLCVLLFFTIGMYVYVRPIEVRRGNQKPCPRSSYRCLYASVLDLGIESKYIAWVVSALSQRTSHISSPIISILTMHYLLYFCFKIIYVDYFSMDMILLMFL